MSRPTAPPCIHCDQPAELVTGETVYPHRSDLHGLKFWLCAACEAYVGCHKSGDGTQPLGYPCDEETRRARSYVHRLLDPIWQTADKLPCYSPENEKARRAIRRTARSRVYLWLATEMGITVEDCHVSHFNIVQCRQAYAILKKAPAYDAIRAKLRKEAAE